jgi:DNA repair protein RecO (recombination protein O)
VLHKTKAIVFRFVKYGETSIIATLFTEQFGLQSYIINGIRGKSKTNKIALYQPLTLLDLIVYHKENAGIMRIKEARCLYPYESVSYDIRKSSIALFICEILNKAVKEQSHTQDIFQFIADSLIFLDTHQQIENFHLQFLLGLSRHLGFGTNQASEILGVRVLDEAEENILNQLLHSEYTTVMVISYAQRQQLLSQILRFYTSHIDNFGEIKSMAVLKEVLSQ